jgi:hypothetical protein
MKPLICVMLATMLLGGATVGASVAEANGRKHWKHRHHDDRDRDYRDRRDYRDYRDDGYRGSRGRYVSEREVYLVREYYRPHYRYDPRPRHRYYRSGYLPHGWHRRVRPYPVYLERDLIVLPRGYRRGIIDGHAVVYSGSGLIIDVAVLF